MVPFLIQVFFRAKWPLKVTWTNLHNYYFTRIRINFWESLFYSSFVAIGLNPQNKTTPRLFEGNLKNTRALISLSPDRHSPQGFSTLFGSNFIWMIVILKCMTVAPVCSLNLPRLDMILFLDLLSLRIFDNYSVKWGWVWCEQLCIKENVIHWGQGRGSSWILPKVVRCEMRGNLVINAMLPRTQTFPSRWKCASKGRREGDNGRDGASPAACTLPMVPCGHHQSPAFSACLYDAKNKAPEEEVERNG